jgi:UDPglucose 6-dehydrogenase
MRICIIGTGYVGLVTGTCFAEIGHNVVCVDKDEAKIARLRNAEIPIFEPGLADIVKSNLASGRLKFSTDIEDGVRSSARFFFIAVGTPPHPETGRADLKYVYAAAGEVAQTLKQHAPAGSFSVFVTKSTVPVGTNVDIARIAAKHLPAESFAVASNPEFLREGCAIEDFMKPDRIVVGSDSERARALLEELYRPLTRQGRPLVVTSSVETAELIKYAANAFLATKITYINELSRLCEKLGADVEELALGIGFDKRIGDRFLKTGPGYGGSCFPKDTLALVKTAEDAGSPMGIVETVMRSNQIQQSHMLEKVRVAIGGNLKGKTLAVLGVAFKAHTDDVRDSPALPLIGSLCDAGARIRIYDPEAMDNARRELSDPDVTFVGNTEQAISGADAAIIVTEWPEFARAPWPQLASTMKAPLLIDLRNMFTLEDAATLGLRYVSVGRKTVSLAS